MRVLILSILSLLWVSPVFAAPIWIERQFVPVNELIDDKFLQHSDEATVEIDYAVWATFLETYLEVDDAGIARVAYSSVATEDKAGLIAFISGLVSMDPASLTKEQQFAYWINLYNAATIALVLDHYPQESIRDIEVSGDGPWDTVVAEVAGVALTLNNIEHGIIRPVFKDARIHYAVNCASVGCPNLASVPYTAETVDDMLTDAAREYVGHPRGVSVRRGRVTASKIYGWYREDFGADEAEVLDHIRQYATPELIEKLQGVETIRSYKYDWDLNEVRR